MAKGSRGSGRFGDEMKVKARRIDRPTHNFDGLPSDNNQGKKDELYTELWYACAGPLVYVPKIGDTVFYLPQGHLEQVEACTCKDSAPSMPRYQIPWKILCRVVHVQLKAEAGSDEVYAHIILLPEPKQNEATINEDAGCSSLPTSNETLSFTKKVTPSDTNTHGGFSILKRHADSCLPPLDMSVISDEPPSQELKAKDLNGSEWHFRHIYRGKPKRHLLTSGWSVFVSSKKLLAGDEFIFLRGKNEELRVGIRRAVKLQNEGSTTIISAHSMQHGILASALHAICTGAPFTVYYRPWTKPAEYIVPYGQFIKSTAVEYLEGTRFRMPFEDEDCIEQGINKFEGTIVGVEDIDPIRWPDSAWRSLMVKWDISSNTLVRPERVSPWDIEPIGPVLDLNRVSFTDGRKRPRESDVLAPLFGGLTEDGALQGQEIGDMSTNKFTLSNPEGQFSFPSGNAMNLDNPDSSCPTFCWHIPYSQQKDRIEAPLVMCKPFRFSLVNTPLKELPSPQVATPAGKLDSPISDSVASQSRLSKPSRSPPEINSYSHCKNWSTTNRSCTKVLKYGTTLRRSIDLSRFDRYDELIHELDQMFDFKGSLSDGSFEWHVTYIDDEGDNMLIGDHFPWQEFQSTVRKIIICPKENI